MLAERVTIVASECSNIVVEELRNLFMKNHNFSRIILKFTWSIHRGFDMAGGHEMRIGDGLQARLQLA
jgi:hypothetical protein